VVTDPPAGISFMNKSWDSDKGGRDQWIKWMSTVMAECLRVLKPGGHALVWAIPRTSHWTTTAIENAGFEVRDVITHLFGSGFPKSHNIEKATGDERFKGQGTALKPAAEFWILCRKPLSEKTVAKNMCKHGTGGLNIDGSRIGTETIKTRRGDKFPRNYGELKTCPESFHQGRFPANLVFSHTPYCTDEMCDIECAIKQLDEQSGLSSSRGGNPKSKSTSVSNINIAPGGGPKVVRNDSGGASRFFYCAKVSPSERNAGLETETKKVRRSDARPNSGDLSGKFPDHDNRERAGNHHPTVKPIKLMQYLIKLVTPIGGTVLDPFMGSGSTGIAAESLGYKFIGIEQQAEYYEIAVKRIANNPRKELVNENECQVQTPG
jgi:hypothetical protein